MPETDQLDRNASDPPERSNSNNHDTNIRRSAALLSIGNIAGRVLGLIREMVISTYFGATGEVSAFRVAAQVPTLIYDLLAGGMLSAAIVPTLSEYAAADKRAAFAKLAGSLLSLFALLLAVILLVLELFAPQVVWIMAPGLDPALLPLLQKQLRLILPAVWFISMAGIIMGILYAQKRFTFPAMAAAVFNVGIVIATPFLAPSLETVSLAIGILLGSIAQFGIMAWDLQRFLKQTSLQLPLQIIWRHPALRKMVRLYLPIAGVTAISSIQIVIDRNLASRTGDQSIAWMQNATTLQQLPLGLISIAIALASLPRLSQFFTEGDIDSFRRVLGHGLRLVLILIVPAAVGLWMLDGPIIRTIFERGEFEPADTAQVTSALSIYVIGMLFAAIDNPLNFAFYARNNTLLPSLAGLVSIAVYIIAAFALVGEMGYLGLVWADTIKHGSHVLIMSIALWVSIGSLRAHLLRCCIQIVVAAAGMVAIIWLCQATLTDQLFRPENTLTDLGQLVILGGSGLCVYGLILYLFGVTEVRELTSAAIQRLRR